LQIKLLCIRLDLRMEPAPEGKDESESRMSPFALVHEQPWSEATSRGRYRATTQLFDDLDIVDRRPEVAGAGILLVGDSYRKQMLARLQVRTLPQHRAAAARGLYSSMTTSLLPSIDKAAIPWCASVTP
jgi:hypothetical protein